MERSTSQAPIPRKRRKRSPNYAQAEAMLANWYEERDPKPQLANWPGAIGTIAGFLDAGHSAFLLAAAMREAPTISKGCLEVALAKGRPGRDASRRNGDVIERGINAMRDREPRPIIESIGELAERSSYDP